MRRINKSLFYLLSVCLVISLMAGCKASSAIPPAADGEDTSAYYVEMVEVVYFHRAQRCQSCIYAEEETIYTMETYFQDEMASGKMTFRSVNLDDEENTAILEKYDAYTSSLFINAIIDGTDQIKEITEIWFLIGDDQAFMEEVRSEIAKSLGGGEG